MIRVKVPGNILDEPKAEEPMAQPARRGLVRVLTHAWSLDPEEEGSVAHRVRELGLAFACILSGRVPDPPGERPRRPSGESLSSGRRRRPSGECFKKRKNHRT